MRWGRASCFSPTTTSSRPPTAPASCSRRCSRCSLKWVGFAPIAVGERPELPGAGPRQRLLDRCCWASRASPARVSHRSTRRSTVRKTIPEPGRHPPGQDPVRRPVHVRLRQRRVGRNLPHPRFHHGQPHPRGHLLHADALSGDTRLRAPETRREALRGNVVAEEGAPGQRAGFYPSRLVAEEFYEEFHHHYRRVYSLKACFLRATAAPPRAALPVFFLNLYLARRVRKGFTSVVD